MARKHTNGKEEVSFVARARLATTLGRIILPFLWDSFQFPLIFMTTICSNSTTTEIMCFNKNNKNDTNYAAGRCFFIPSPLCTTLTS